MLVRYTLGWLRGMTDFSIVLLPGLLTNRIIVIAGFFTGGALAVRGGIKAARNSAIGCACLLAVIEGVGIGFQRMMAENTRLDVSMQSTYS
jgi:hypothetical protein